MNKLLFALIFAFSATFVQLAPAQDRFGSPENFSPPTAAPRIVVAPPPTWCDPIRVWVDSSQRSYWEGQDVYLTVRTDQDAYIYVFSTDSRGITRQLFPNYFERNNYVRRYQTKQLPSRRYRLVATGPGGWDTIRVVAISAGGRHWAPPHSFGRSSQSDPFPTIRGGFEGARAELQSSFSDVAVDDNDWQGGGYESNDGDRLRERSGPTIMQSRDYNPAGPGSPARSNAGERSNSQGERYDRGNYGGERGVSVRPPHRPHAYWGEGYTHIFVYSRHHYPPCRCSTPCRGKCRLWDGHGYDDRGPRDRDPYDDDYGYDDGYGYDSNDGEHYYRGKDSRETGRLEINTSPSNAEVIINGRHHGKTPFSQVLPEGRYEVEVYRRGYETWTRTLNLEDDATERYRVRLQRD